MARRDGGRTPGTPPVLHGSTPGARRAPSAGQREGQEKDRPPNKQKKGGRRPRQASRGAAGWVRTRSNRRIQPPAAPRAASGGKRGRKAKTKAGKRKAGGVTGTSPTASAGLRLFPNSQTSVFNCVAGHTETTVAGHTETTGDGRTETPLLVVAGRTETTHRVTGHFPDNPSQLEACPVPPRQAAARGEIRECIRPLCGAAVNHRHVINYACLIKTPSP